MKITITKSQNSFLRRIPAVEEAVNTILQKVNPRSGLFGNFSAYINYITGRVLSILPEDILPNGEYSELGLNFKNYILWKMRNEIKKVYDSGKPGKLF